MTIFSLEGIEPSISAPETCWIAHDANVIGNVLIGRFVSIWFGSTLRGDNEPITVGDGCNIQENCVIHTDPGFPFDLGRNCTIGHRAMLHGCSIGDNSLIGMAATILNGARIGANSVVGACSLVTENKVFPEFSLLMGSPAKVVRTLTEAEVVKFGQAAEHYRRNVVRYRTHLARIEPGNRTASPSGGAE